MDMLADINIVCEDKKLLDPKYLPKNRKCLGVKNKISKSQWDQILQHSQKRQFVSLYNDPFDIFQFYNNSLRGNWEELLEDCVPGVFALALLALSTIEGKLGFEHARKVLEKLNFLKATYGTRMEEDLDCRWRYSVDHIGSSHYNFILSDTKSKHGKGVHSLPCKSDFKFYIHQFPEALIKQPAIGRLFKKI